MARISRPPGFDMTYRPTKATFLMPLGLRLPGLLYFGGACAVALTVGLARFFPGSSLYEFVVIRDSTRVLTSTGFAIFLLLSAIAVLVRQSMTGVIVHPDGIELREVLPMGIPRFRRWAWAQIDSVAIPFEGTTRASAPPVGPKLIRLDLWNGTQEFLPRVSKPGDLAMTIERVALARAIPIEGGSGLVDDLQSPFDEDED